MNVPMSVGIRVCRGKTIENIKFSSRARECDFSSLFFVVVAWTSSKK